MLRGFETDRRIPGPPSKEFWIPAIMYYESGGADWIHPAYISPGATADEAAGTWQAPHDFHQFLTFEVHIRPILTVARGLTHRMYACQTGEAWNIHNQLLAEVIVLNTNIMESLDILARLPIVTGAVTAGDKILIRLQITAGNVIWVWGWGGRYI